MPGSPFMVMIFDTQEELSRFLQVNQTLYTSICAGYITSSQRLGKKINYFSKIHFTAGRLFTHWSI